MKSLIEDPVVHLNVVFDVLVVDVLSRGRPRPRRGAGCLGTTIISIFSPARQRSRTLPVSPCFGTASVLRIRTSAAAGPPSRCGWLGKLF